MIHSYYFVYYLFYLLWDRETVVATLTRLLDRSSRNRGLISGRRKISSLIQNRTELHIASYSVRTWVSFSGVERPWRKSGHSLLSSVQAKKELSYNSTPETQFASHNVKYFKLFHTGGTGTCWNWVAYVLEHVQCAFGRGSPIVLMMFPVVVNELF
jgi:hypothetical protein